MRTVHIAQELSPSTPSPFQSWTVDNSKLQRIGRRKERYRHRKRKICVGYIGKLEALKERG
jgi:hypothetical protein